MIRQDKEIKALRTILYGLTRMNNRLLDENERIKKMLNEETEKLKMATADIGALEMQVVELRAELNYKRGNENADC